MLDNKLRLYLNQKITGFFKEEQDISSISEVHGGSINLCFQLKTNKGSYFIKINDAAKYPGIFQAEEKGLKILESAGAFRTPKTYFMGEFEGKTFLLMEHINPNMEKAGFWEDFGTSLAKLHRNTAEHFGLEHDNYIGSLTQYNQPKSTWTDFFMENRLAVQVKLSRDSAKIDINISKKFDKLYAQLDNLFPKENPALIHGDLWTGNYMSDENGNPVIIDPAVYYGHREMDIAMTQLFGGFGAEMYKTYQNEFPMEKGWQERMDLWNLYPLMVHVNLFGGGYLTRVESILRRYL